MARQPLWDWYTRLILAVIAGALLWLCFVGPPRPQMARSPEPIKLQDVNVVAVNGKAISARNPLVVEVAKTVKVEGTGLGQPIKVKGDTVFGGVEVQGSTFGSPVKVELAH